MPCVAIHRFGCSICCKIKRPAYEWTYRQLAAMSTCDARATAPCCWRDALRQFACPHNLLIHIFKDVRMTNVTTTALGLERGNDWDNLLPQQQDWLDRVGIGHVEGHIL